MVAEQAGLDPHVLPGEGTIARLCTLSAQVTWQQGGVAQGLRRHLAAINPAKTARWCSPLRSSVLRYWRPFTLTWAGKYLGRARKRALILCRSPRSRLSPRTFCLTRRTSETLSTVAPGQGGKTRPSPWLLSQVRHLQEVRASLNLSPLGQQGSGARFCERNISGAMEEQASGAALLGRLCSVNHIPALLS